MNNNYIEYVTSEGDTFDIIALDLYNSEFKSHLIMQANPSYINTLIFSQGIKLKCPLIEEEPAETLPPWKR